MQSESSSGWLASASRFTLSWVNVYCVSLSFQCFQATAMSTINATTPFSTIGLSLL